MNDNALGHALAADYVKMGFAEPVSDGVICNNDGDEIEIESVDRVVHVYENGIEVFDISYDDPNFNKHLVVCMSSLLGF